MSSATPASKPGQADCRNLGGVPGLITPDQRFRDDDGAAEPLLAAALAAYAAGQASEHAVLTALARARLLVPVVAALTQTEDTKAPDGRVLRREKASDMTIPVLTGRDGRRAIIAFTSMDALSSWRRDARPLPAGTDQVCQAAAAEAAHAVVVDVAGPAPLVVEGARLAALAAGKPAPLPADDPDVRAAVDAVVAADPGITAAELVNGPGGTSETEGARETAGTMETEGSRETAGTHGNRGDQGGTRGTRGTAGAGEAVRTRETAGTGETGGTDLTVRLVLSAPPGGAAEGFASAQPEAVARRAAAAIMTSLAGRFRRGIEIAVVPGPPG